MDWSSFIAGVASVFLLAFVVLAFFVFRNVWQLQKGRHEAQDAAPEPKQPLNSGPTLPPPPPHG